MRGLRYRELARAVGPWMGGLGFVLSRVTELKGEDLIPLEVTLIEPITGEPQVGREIERLGFAKLGAFTLPEFTGDNASHLYVAHDGGTIAEAIWFKGTGGERTTVAFSSLIEGGPVARLRSVELPRDAPLDPPEGCVVHHQGGTLAERAERHRTALADVTGTPVRMDALTIFEHLHIGHLESMRYALARGAYQVAEPELVAKLFAAKGLSREGDEVTRADQSAS